MRILHVAHSLEPGGMENGIVNMARALTPRGFEFYVACLERRGAFAERLPSPDHAFVLGKKSGFSPGAAWNLGCSIARLRPDIIHSHNLGPLIYSGLATFGGRRAPLIQGEHSQLTDDERSPQRLRQRRWLYRGCRAIHTVSAAMRDELISLGFPRSKITAITNGVDTSHFAPGDRQAARAALGLPTDAQCLGIVGRFGPFKQHRQLIEAFESIAAQFPRTHLLIAGGGGSEEAAIIARAGSSSVRGHIHLLGFQADPRVCYHALDLLIIPSTNEGLSNVALEAMACGVPVLVRSGCGHEQIITSGFDGWISSLDSAEKLANELDRIFSEPASLVDFGANARKKVVEQFSLASMTDAYEHLYRACARRLP